MQQREFHLPSYFPHAFYNILVIIKTIWLLLHQCKKQKNERQQLKLTVTINYYR